MTLAQMPAWELRTWFLVLILLLFFVVFELYEILSANRRYDEEIARPSPHPTEPPVVERTETHWKGKTGGR